MDKKTKVYLFVIAVLLFLIILKPIMDSGMFVDNQQKPIQLTFIDPSVKHLRLLEDMKRNKCISSFDYDVYEKKGTIYISGKQREKAISYILDRVDDLTASTEDNYEISVSSTMDEFTIQSDSDMDFKLVMDDYVDLVEYCEIYQKCNGYDSWKCRGVIKNRETGKVYTDSTQPGENINYEIDIATNIKDSKRAIEVFNNNLYTKFNYPGSYVDNGVFYSPAGGLKIKLPENAQLEYGDDLNEVNELEPGYTAQDLKSRLMNGAAVSELHISPNDETIIGFSVNYSDTMYDEEYYDEYVERALFKKLTSEYSDAKLEKKTFLGKKCNLMTFKADDVYQYILFEYHDGFSYVIWGQYKDTEGEQFIKDIISSIEKGD